MDSMTRRVLWLISFNLLVAAWCFGVGMYVLLIGNVVSSLINVALAALNVFMAYTNYNSMQQRRKMNGLEPFMFRRIKVPVPVYEFIQQHLYK